MAVIFMKYLPLNHITLYIFFAYVYISKSVSVCNKDEGMLNGANSKRGFEAINW